MHTMPAYTLAFLRLYKSILYNTLYNATLNTNISVYRAIIHRSYTIVAQSIKHSIMSLYKHIRRTGVY